MPALQTNPCRITYHVGSFRTFDRLFHESTLEEMKDVIRSKLKLPANAAMTLMQVREGMNIDLEDDEDFESLTILASNCLTIDIRVNLLNVEHRTIASRRSFPGPSANLETRHAVRQVVEPWLQTSRSALLEPPQPLSVAHSTINVSVTPDVTPETATAVEERSARITKKRPASPSAEPPPKRRKLKKDASVAPVARETPVVDLADTSAVKASTKLGNKMHDLGLQSIADDDDAFSDDDAESGTVRRSRRLSIKRKIREASAAAVEEEEGDVPLRSPKKTTLHSQKMESDRHMVAVVHEPVAEGEEETGKVKRPRGRPRKNKEIDVEPVPQAEGESGTVKRPRGRPRKNKEIEPRRPVSDDEEPVKDGKGVTAIAARTKELSNAEKVTDRPESVVADEGEVSRQQGKTGKKKKSKNRPSTEQEGGASQPLSAVGEGENAGEVGTAKLSKKLKRKQTSDEAVAVDDEPAVADDDAQPEPKKKKKKKSKSNDDAAKGLASEGDVEQSRADMRTTESEDVVVEQDIQNASVSSQQQQLVEASQHTEGEQDEAEATDEEQTTIVLPPSAVPTTVGKRDQRAIAETIPLQPPEPEENAADQPTQETVTHWHSLRGTGTSDTLEHAEEQPVRNKSTKPPVLGKSRSAAASLPLDRMSEETNPGEQQHRRPALRPPVLPRSRSAATSQPVEPPPSARRPLPKSLTSLFDSSPEVPTRSLPTPAAAPISRSASPDEDIVATTDAMAATTAPEKSSQNRDNAAKAATTAAVPTPEPPSPHKNVVPKTTGDLSEDDESSSEDSENDDSNEEDSDENDDDAEGEDDPDVAKRIPKGLGVPRPIQNDLDPLELGQAALLITPPVAQSTPLFRPNTQPTQRSTLDDFEYHEPLPSQYRSLSSLTSKDVASMSQRSRSFRNSAQTTPQPRQTALVDTESEEEESDEESSGKEETTSILPKGRMAAATVAKTKKPAAARFF